MPDQRQSQYEKNHDHGYQPNPLTFFSHTCIVSKREIA